MNFDIVALDITDVMGKPIVGFFNYTLTLNGFTLNTIRTTLPISDLVMPPGINKIQIAINHPNYAPETVTVKSDNSGTIYCNNRICKFSGSGIRLKLSLSLGRIRRAPCTIPPDSLKTKGDQLGVFLSPEFPSNSYATLDGLLIKSPPLKAVRDIPDPRTFLADPELDEWERFSTQVYPNLDLRNTGGFLWLEYGAVGTTPAALDPRFLIAMWAPPPPQSIPKKGLDYVMFYSPSTATPSFAPSVFPFHVNYPYVVLSQTVKQSYVLLAYRYLFPPLIDDSPCLIHQLLASDHPAVIIMPIFPNCTNTPIDQWQPFESQAGVHRLLLEVSRFLHREGYGSSNSALSNWNGRVCGGVMSTPTLPTNFSSISTEIPLLRNVTLAGFSSGSAGLVPTLTRVNLSDSKKYPTELFAGDPSSFVSVWREFWGLDLKLDHNYNPLTESSIFQKNALDWLDRFQTRYLRLYQSEITMGETRPAVLFSVLNKLPHSSKIKPRISKKNKSIWAEDWREDSQRWSCIMWSKAYLESNTAPSNFIPIFPFKGNKSEAEIEAKIHQFALSLGFSHAAALRYDRDLP